MILSGVFPINVAKVTLLVVLTLHEKSLISWLDSFFTWNISQYCFSFRREVARRGPLRQPARRTRSGFCLQMTRSGTYLFSARSRTNLEPNASNWKLVCARWTACGGEKSQCRGWPTFTAQITDVVVNGRWWCAVSAQEERPPSAQTRWHHCSS